MSAVYFLPSRSLSSPVKTNPLMEAERAARPAQYVSRTPQWCPGLMQTSTTRVLKVDTAGEGTLGFHNGPTKSALRAPRQRPPVLQPVLEVWRR